MPPIPQSLKNSRRHNLCDEEGLLPAIRQAIRAGDLQGYRTPEQYLDDVLEGRVADEIARFGWHLCHTETRCQRHGRCLRRSS